ncbi:TRAP transporter substrate-binding protein [Halalkalicoccus tibetensis]|uniref:TRAP transporter substrate-binding protein n=1 Tax=Halalkalicoccus tibetensis TaxID=175632 RepID=A0ABD5V837_9EURY
MRLSRRRALKSAGALGAIGLAGCTGDDDDENGDSGTMRVATAYAEDSPVPLAQQEFVENVEEATDGELEPDLYPGGQLTSGPDLGSQLQGGSVEVGSLSYSNLSPYADIMDIVNLPYFAGDFESFLNLITSDVWEEVAHEELRQQGFEPLYTWMSSPRAVGVREEVGGAVESIDDVAGLDIRIAASDIGEQTWDLAGANAVPVDWGETAQALEEGVVDGLHVSVPPLAAYGFEDSLGSITVIDQVMDVGIFVASRDWFDDLEEDVQEDIHEAAEETFEYQLDGLVEMAEESEQVFEEAGVEINELDDAALEEWEEATGYQRSEWDDWKTDLAGDMETFEALEEATEQESDYEVPGYDA